MNRRIIIILIVILEALLLGALIYGSIRMHREKSAADETTVPPVSTTEPFDSETTAPVTTTAATTEATTEPETTTEPEPQEIYDTLSFAGDCTLGNFKDDYGSEYSFMGVVGDDYDYPFAQVQQWFSTDDFTLVNFEGTLTDSRAATEKTFNFHAPPAYAAILTAGSVECVSLSNNHTYDYGQTGYDDTVTALTEEGIAFAETNGTCLYTTESGLIIGVYANKFSFSLEDMQTAIASLRESGAEIVICSFHWGIEKEYSPNGDQIYVAHAAIDAGADIVFGHHPHVLQPIEEYNGGIIFYSLGNFSFGGNRCPSDMDSAVVQQEVVRSVDGTVSLGKLTIIPVSISGQSGLNDYQPTPMEVGSEGYERVLSKLGRSAESDEKDEKS